MTTISNDKKCEFCDKRGLPVMPVRYTVAPDSTDAPKISKPFKVTDADDKPIPLKGKIHYTTRLMRTGYLYVYDENRKRWETYYITPDANFMRMETTEPMPPAFVGRVPCISSGHPQVASMITISDPRNATNVWFGYSEVEWTPAVLQKHKDESYRKRHMQMLDVKAALGTGGKAHTHPIAKLGEMVAEYNLNPTDRKTDYFLFDNPIKYNPRKLQTNDVIRVADALRTGKGTILALHDPAGLARELSAVMRLELTRQTEAVKMGGKEDPKYGRKVAVASVIQQMRAAVMSKAEDDRIDRTTSDGAIAAAAAGMGTLFDPKLRKSVAAAGSVDAAQLEQAQKEAWRKYTHRQSGAARFDETTVDTFHKDYNDKVKEITTTHIDPLGESHAAWMRSLRLQHYLQCNYDADDMRSGVAYMESVLQATDGTEGVKACFSQYQTWFNAPKIDTENILLRALTYNNDTLVKSLNDATAFDNRAIPWDNLQDAYKTAMGTVSAGHADRAAVLLARMTGPMAMAVDAVIDGAARPLVTYLGMLSGGWQFKTFPGSRKEFRRFLVEMIIKSSDVRLNKGQIKIAVDREIKRAQIKGEKLDGRYQAKWLYCVDPIAAKNGRVALEAPKTINDIRFHKFKAVAGTELRAAFAISLLQYYCLTKSIADYGKSLEGDKSEALSRLVAGSMGLAGGMIEAAGRVIQNANHIQMPWAQGLKAQKLSAVLEVGGKALGFAGAVIMAGWDLWKGFEEFGKNNNLTAGLYLASAVLGIAAAYMLTFMLFNPFTLLIVVAFMATVYFLETTKDNPVQTWLENSIFGINSSYKDGGKEMLEFSKAIS